MWINNPYGELEIGPELLERLTAKGFTNEEVHLALPRALKRAQGDRRPTRLLEMIHDALSYVRQDAAKGRNPRTTAPTTRAGAVPYRPGTPEFDAEHARLTAIMETGTHEERVQARVHLRLIEEHGFLPAPKEAPS